MRWQILLVVLLLAPLVLAEAPQQDLYDYDDLVLKLRLENDVQIVPQGGTPDVDEVTAELSWYPRESYRQIPENIITSPKAHKRPSDYQYLWLDPRTNVLEFTLDAMVTTTNEPLPVTRKIAFPIQSLPEELAVYTWPAEMIDTNDEIEAKALELTHGSDDLFVVVYNVADWVTKNIEYNLTSMTLSATQSSTWVMANRQGVCDELTSLFISMLRSLGIPARFVAGVSYTNLPEFARPWGGHGWAEVWFPGVGWVPFDVTYGTYGYVDATHIKLKESLDSAGSSVEYTMRATSAGLMTRALDMDVDIIDKQKNAQEPVTVELTVFDELVDLDSHNLVTAKITNNEEYYLSGRFQLANTQNIEVLNEQERNILLKPRESKTLTFLLKTEGLQEGFRYDFPIKLYAGLQEVAATSFAASHGQTSYDEEFFSSYLERAEERSYNDKISLDCIAETETAYIGEPIPVGCKLTNNGPTPLNGISLCIGETCETRDVAQGESARLRSELLCEDAGMKTLLATATHRLVNSYGLVRYNCIDKAAVSITEIAHPDTLGFDEKGDISFLIDKASDTVPEQVTITVRHENFEQWWKAEELVNPQKFSYTIQGRNLDLGKNNTVTIEVTYQDRLGRDYKTSEDFTIQLEELTFWEKVQLRMQDFEQWFSGLLG